MQQKLSHPFLQPSPTHLSSLRKKRPSKTKLDIQKLYQQSLTLSQLHKKLYQQNQQLKKNYEQVQQSKISRQHLISQVQKIVKQKSIQLSSKSTQQSSWLVHKLHQKILSLKHQINHKSQSIHQLILGKQNQQLLRKQNQLQCLHQINQYLQSLSPSLSTNPISNKNIQQIVWMDQYLSSSNILIQQLQNQLQLQQRQTNRIITSIANNKIQLKRIKQIQNQYQIVQQKYLQELKKKQQQIFDNKSYLTNLIKQRDLQASKLGKLNQKKILIQEEEKFAITKLQQKLHHLRLIYQENKHHKPPSKRPSNHPLPQQRTQRWVKRVTFQQVDSIAKNMNLSFALKGITQSIWIEQFFKDQLPTYSIQQVMQKLQSYPFEMKNFQHRRLLARYVVEDNNSGPMLQDDKTSQDAPIIKSILCKLIGISKVYTPQQISHYRQQLGTKLAKYWPLVQQCIHIKQGVRNIITRQMLQQGIQAAQLQLTTDQINYASLFLFSWSKDINKLELNKLGKIKELGIKFQ